MNMDEEFGLDRRIGFETDDEENEAERDCNDENYSDSDTLLLRSHNASNDCCNNMDNVTWPQSYRQSMDMYTSMTPPSFNFLNEAVRPSFVDCSLNQPLISESNVDKEQVLTAKSSAASQLSRFSSTNLPPSEEQCSYAQSVLNAINVLCGIGLLSTPYALKEGGWWSLVILFILAGVTCYTGILLKRCLESSLNLKTYPDIGQAAFGVPGRVFLAVILYIELYSSCVEFLIMMGDNLSALYPDVQFNFTGFNLGSHEICLILSTLFILPTVWLRNLSLLSYISIGGVVTALMVSVCLFWVGLVDQVEFHSKGTTLDIVKLPITVGLFGFCFGGHSVFPNIFSSMKEPSKFTSVLVVSFIVSCLSYAAVGSCGFLMFGDATKSQFTLNMPTQFVASKVAVWTTVAAPLTKYALTITPVALSVEELLPPPLNKSHGVSILVRTSLVFSTFFVALTFPYFGSMMAFIGSLAVMLVGLIFPCACYLSICSDKLTNLQISACVLTMIIGLVCAVVGTYAAVTTQV